MKLKILSDLHLEFMDPKQQKKVMKQAYAGEYDYLVMAGDIGKYEQTKELFSNKKVISIFGNHELYRYGYTRGEETNFVKYIDGHKFVCSTMFSKLDPIYLVDIYKNINDFKYVTITEFQSLYEKSRKFLDENVDEGCIVVTHFVPTYMACSPKYRTAGYQKNNSFFITEMGEFILERKPKKWIFGHTHLGFSSMIGDTQLICNPMGYRHCPLCGGVVNTLETGKIWCGHCQLLMPKDSYKKENLDFNPNLIIDI